MLKKLFYKMKKNLFRQVENYDIDYEELKRMKLNGAQIVDVRNNREYSEGHIEGSINIPDYEINKKFEKIFTNHNQIIILYCSSGNRSKNACKKLIRRGYTNIFNLYEGIENLK